MTILPLITPPFVVAMALIVLFGRTGIVTTAMWDWFDIPRSRWIYGLPGVLLAQVLAQAPIAFLLLDGATRSSPSPAGWSIACMARVTTPWDRRTSRSVAASTSTSAVIRSTR
jgi:ABC-type Fe3+ transport system permease subunit